LVAEKKPPPPPPPEGGGVQIEISWSIKINQFSQLLR